MYEMTDDQFQTVYNLLSFALACMMATTIFLWARVSSIHEEYKSAVLISGLVTFIAAYHYMRIFNSWNSSYMYDTNGGPTLTGKPFNDAYRYMEWLLTVPLLLIEIIFCCNLTPDQVVSKAWALGVSSGLMIALGYPGEMLISENTHGVRFMFWAAAMVPFLYVVYTLLVGLKEAIASEGHPKVASMLTQVCYATVISWCTYPVVYLFPMLGFEGPHAVIAIQLGYCVSDIISKCGVGFLIYNIPITKSMALNNSLLGK